MFPNLLSSCAAKQATVCQESKGQKVKNPCRSDTAKCWPHLKLDIGLQVVELDLPVGPDRHGYQSTCCCKDQGPGTDVAEVMTTQCNRLAKDGHSVPKDAKDNKRLSCASLVTEVNLILSVWFIQNRVATWILASFIFVFIVHIASSVVAESKETQCAVFIIVIDGHVVLDE